MRRISATDKDTMAVVIALLRGVNVGGRNKLPMERLRAICEGLGLERPRTFIQSGNVIFETMLSDETALAVRLEAEIETEFGFRPSVVLRSVPEMKSVVERNPFRERDDVAPDRLLVTFLQSDPGEEARSAIRAIPVVPEELVVDGREIFVYYRGGAGQTKLPLARIERAQRVPGTTRNWNSVLKLLALAKAR
jgi:uncharacterized protein (DUF1697 family)